MGRKLLLLLLILPTIALSQVPVRKTYFSDAIAKNIKRYEKESRVAYAEDDLERAQFLFDSLITHAIKGSYLNNFKLRKFSRSKEIQLYDIEKPVFMMTYASWCVPGVGEVPAFNSLADKYHDQVEFVVLFWGSRDKIKKIKKKYVRQITVLYVDESENTNDFTIRTMKHSLGFPTSFLMDADKKILDVRRKMNHHYSEDFTTAYNDHYQNFMSGLSMILNLESEAVSDDFITKN